MELPAAIESSTEQDILTTLQKHDMETVLPTQELVPPSIPTTSDEQPPATSPLNPTTPPPPTPPPTTLPPTTPPQSTPSPPLPPPTPPQSGATASTAAVAVRPSLASPPRSPPQPPPPMFVNALNLQPQAAKADRGGSKTTGGGSNTEEERMDTSSQTTLASKFKEDPHSVLQLLQSALSMDKLASLLQTEYHGDKEQLEGLQQHLEGEEELQLKKKRDTSYARCSELRKKLKSSREAQQQIAAFSSKTNSAQNTAA